ncbi:MAG: hypothetical protein M1827_006697 [Pycnora praestabilis]|nr:MAG: hypothetical protein M1827_006697 [Pycnora praestabilis]
MSGEEEWNGEFDPFEDPEEKRVLFAALDSFYQYRKNFHYITTHLRRQHFYALPSSQWQLLALPPFSILDSLNNVDDAIDKNADIAHKILTTGLSTFGLSADPQDPEVEWQGKATPSDMDKARTTVRQFYRDWAAEGAAEREACYAPVLRDLALEFSDDAVDKGSIKVLVPGAGLGRLVFEICKAGYCTEGNEISYHALLASSWILNHVAPGQQMELYPWALSFSNHVSRADQLKNVSIPDVHPGTALDEASQGRKTHAFERLSMCAADFTVLYGDEGHRNMYNTVATVFFIDTAPNLIRYIMTIWNCLKVGGIWINLGPLLWHFEESRPVTNGEEIGEGEVEEKEWEGQTEKRRKRRQIGIAEAGSVELTDEEVMMLVEKSGFKIEKRASQGIECGYIQDPRSMLQNVYRVSHWVARKIG